MTRVTATRPDWAGSELEPAAQVRVVCLGRAGRFYVIAHGRYLHDVDHTYGNSTGGHHVLVVAADGSTAYAATRYSFHYGQPAITEAVSAQRCTLREPAYFDGCLAALALGVNSDAAWQCTYFETPLVLELRGRISGPL